MTGKCTYTASGVHKLKERRRHARGIPATREKGKRTMASEVGGSSFYVLKETASAKNLTIRRGDGKTFMREVRRDLRNNDAVRKMR
jgi:hypothetical protein